MLYYRRKFELTSLQSLVNPLELQKKGDLMLQNTNVDWKMWQKKKKIKKNHLNVCEKFKKDFHAARSPGQNSIIIYILYNTHARITDLQN